MMYVGTYWMRVSKIKDIPKDFNFPLVMGLTMCSTISVALGVSCAIQLANANTIIKVYQVQY